MKSARAILQFSHVAFARFLFIMVLVSILSACASIGPKSINRDQLDYGQSIGQNWKNQLLALIQSGYDSRLLFTWAVEAINGLRNYSVTAGDKREPDPEFYEFVEHMRELQIKGGVAFQQSTDPATKSEVIVFFRDISASEQVRKEGRQARSLIGLSPVRQKFRVVYSLLLLRMMFSPSRHAQFCRS